MGELNIPWVNRIRVVAATCPDCSCQKTLFVDVCRPTTEEISSRKTLTVSQSEERRESALMRCDYCGLHFRWPGLTANEMNALYQSIPRDSWREEGDNRVAWSLARDILQKRLQSTSSPSVLDVGAFTGGFLDSLPKNWQKYAVEPSEEAVAVLRARGYSVLARHVDDEQLGAAGQSFDAITLIDVYEHLAAPSKALRKICRLLKPGGVLLISTGNAAHWTWKMLRGNHWYLHSAQHCCIADDKVLQRTLLQSGLEIIGFTKHAHSAGKFGDRLLQTAEIVFFWTRRRSWITRKLGGVIVRLPGLSYLRHRNSPPFSNALRDHQLVIGKRN